MNKDPNTLASREEMQKVAKETQRDYLAEADTLEDVTELRLLWATAKAAGASKAVLDKVAARAKSVGSGSVSS
jgi:hypothetical protein